MDEKTHSHMSASENIDEGQTSGRCMIDFQMQDSFSDA